MLFLGKIDYPFGADRVSMAASATKGHPRSNPVVVSFGVLPRLCLGFGPIPTLVAQRAILRLAILRARR